MDVHDQVITDDYAVYNGDSCQVMKELPDESVHMAIHSPPFCGLFVYSSSPQDLSNNRTYQEFFDHYDYIVKEIHRTLLPGRWSMVHCMDVPRDGANIGGGLTDFPGDIIRQHERLGYLYCGRYHVWKEPLGVRNRTMAKGLTHQTIIEDSSQCDVASADYVLRFLKKGTNPIPVENPHGLMTYAGSRKIPLDVMKYKGYQGKQTQNRYSQWIWRQYASAFWDDVRIDRVLRYKTARDKDDEKHMHPLQLDVIERLCVLYTNPGEVVATPFLGVGSEVAGAVMNGRKGWGCELKPSYFRQAVKNLAAIDEKSSEQAMEQPGLLDEYELEAVES